MTDPVRSLCTLCGEPMPAGEEMFKFHGYSGPCPAPPLPKQTMKWKMVPEEPTEAMGREGADYLPVTPGGATNDCARHVYEVMLAAAPAYEPTEADVERVARAACDPLRSLAGADSYCEGPDCDCWKRQIVEARAAIRAFLEGK